MDENALVDTGAVNLCLPEHLAMQLELQVQEKREVRTADGKSHWVDYAGPVRVSMLGRSCFTGALIMGDRVLLGAIPLEDMDLVVDARRQQVTVNPANPNFPVAIVK